MPASQVVAWIIRGLKNVLNVPARKDMAKSHKKSPIKMPELHISSWYDSYVSTVFAKMLP